MFPLELKVLLETLRFYYMNDNPNEHSREWYQSKMEGLLRLQNYQWAEGIFCEVFDFVKDLYVKQ